MQKEDVFAKISIIWNKRHYYRIFFFEASQTSFKKKRNNKIFNYQTFVYNIVSFRNIKYILKKCDTRVAIETNVNCTHLVNNSKFYLRTKKIMIYRLIAFALIISLKNSRVKQIKFMSKNVYIDNIIHNYNSLLN